MENIIGRSAHYLPDNKTKYKQNKAFAHPFKSDFYELSHSIRFRPVQNTFKSQLTNEVKRRLVMQYYSCSSRQNHQSIKSK